MCQQDRTHFTLWQIGQQRLEVTFDQGPLVSDAGLLAIRALERSLGILTELAARLPDPRAPAFVRHSTERLLTQQVYQILAGYPDSNDANELRQDALFQILAEQVPTPDEPLASASTLTRFAYAHTRRGPREGEPEVLLVRRAAQVERLKVVNAFLVELFLRTREQPPAEVVLDADATDDPVHGGQALSGYHGYYRQHQYLPLLVFDGASGFPLACWLRPGTAHASLGAVEVLRGVVRALRAAWPGVVIKLRGDNGLAVPAIYDFCEAEDLRYALGLASNAVLERAVAQASRDVEEYYRAYGRRDPLVQRFEEIKGYQASSWPHPRRVVAKVERTPQGSQRRFVVTDLPQKPDEVYRDFYVRRGAVPEQPIGELKNGLSADRLSACGFCANAWRLLLHVVAYALVVLFRQAGASVEEVARASVGTLRQRLWKVPAVVATGVRRVVLRLSAAWPWREVFGRVLEAVMAFRARLAEGRAVPAPAQGLPS
jgi:Transposase DDE domain group 1